MGTTTSFRSQQEIRIKNGRKTKERRWKSLWAPSVKIVKNPLSITERVRDWKSKIDTFRDKASINYWIIKEDEGRRRIAFGEIT